MPIRSVIIRASNQLREYREGPPASRSAVGNLAPPESTRPPPRRPGRQYVGKRVVIVGLFGSRCGLQRGADLMVRDLQASGVEVLAFDVTAIMHVTPTLETTATADPARLAAWHPTDVVIHINPPLFARILTALPPAIRSNATLIGYWAWELTVLPHAWRDCAGLIDEVWAPSPFVAEAMTTGMPEFTGAIRVVPHAVDRDPMPATPSGERAALRARFGLPPDSFIVGTSFSFDSNYTRKNPCAAIDAFRLAFRADERVCLVIRCNDVAHHPRLFDHLVSFAGGDPRILIWDMATFSCSIRQFYGLLDLYVSLHRSEGYGLNLVEAAQAGVAVLATGWGLAPDIAIRPEVRTVSSRLVVPLDVQGVYDRNPDAVWAEPDCGDAVLGLQEARAAWSAHSVDH